MPLVPMQTHRYEPLKIWLSILYKKFGYSMNSTNFTLPRVPQMTRELLYAMN